MVVVLSCIGVLVIEIVDPLVAGALLDGDDVAVVTGFETRLLLEPSSSPFPLSRVAFDDSSKVLFVIIEAVGAEILSIEQFELSIIFRHLHFFLCNH